jgi:dTDP-4-dehydrorhamnose 3,5-epimerase
MKFLRTSLRDVIIVEPRVLTDERGFFLETWQAQKFADGGIDVSFVQDNHSASRQWVLRGLHYQIARPQGKLVRVTLGEVFDVAVDMRKSSPTFGRYVGEYLSADNRRMMWVPPGFAHGFLVMSERVEFMYKCTDFYSPQDERSLLWSDPDVDIAWPLPPGIEPIVSSRDSRAARFADAEYYP